MLRKKDDVAFATAGAELHLVKFVPDGHGGVKREGKKVLLPLREQRRREIAAEAVEIVIGLQQKHVNPDAPLRYEPEPMPPRTQSKPAYFHSGLGSKRLRKANAAYRAKQDSSTT